MKKQTLSYGEISALCLELSLFLHAGAECGGALTLLAEEETNPQRKQSLLDMAARTDAGYPLSDTFEQSGTFPADVVNMLRVGERTGHPEETLRALSVYYDSRDTMEHQLRAAILSPSILLLVMLTVIVLLLTKVLPVFSDVYASLGGQLTGVAGGLLRLGLQLNALLPVLCLLLAAAAGGMIAYSCSPSVQARMTGFWRKRFGDRGISRQMRTARFAQALSMALASGMTEEEALESAALLLTDHPDAAARCRECAGLVADGEPLSAAMRNTELLPPAECRLLALGFAGGSGEAAAEEIARRLNRDAEQALEQRIGQIEPVMVLVTSLLIGAVLLTVMLPLVHIMTAIG